MVLMDGIAIALVGLFIFLGVFVGFGKGLIFFTKGLTGKIISIVVCYFLFGIVLSWPFVQNLLKQFVQALENNGSGFCKFLLKIRIEMVVFAIALFIIVQLLRVLIVHLIGKAFSADIVPIKVINKILGVILFLAALAILVLVIFQIIAWIDGTTGGFYNMLKGSFLKLDSIFKNNPLNSIFTATWRKITGGV